MEDFQRPVDDDAVLLELLARSPSSLSPPGAASSDGRSSSATEKNMVRRRPIPRKGHTKSRNGCLQCKRRKVKCQENRPECDHCVRIGLVCEYPAPPPRQFLDLNSTTTASSSPPSTQALSHSNALTHPAPAYALNSTPATFSMQDLRFFQHFLLTGYPPLPLNGVAVWKDVAVISHEFDYLVYAMLGCAASHLSLLSGADYSSPALTHRVSAIQSLNAALSRPPKSKAEADARFAATMTLTFQASYMEEGMLEFLSMVRGCHIVATSGMPHGFNDSIFSIFTPEKHNEQVRRLRGSEEPDPLDVRLVDALLGSLRDLAPMCRSTYELGCLGRIEKAMRLAKLSSVEAFHEFALLYSWMTAERPSSEFETLIDPSNHRMQILLMHFFLGESIVGDALGPILRKSWPFRAKIVLAWIERSAAKLPPEFDPFAHWVLAIARAALGCGLEDWGGWHWNGLQLSDH